MATDRAEIMKVVTDLLEERFEVDPVTVTEETRQNTLGIDSILMVDLMMDVESELGFTFESMDFPKNPSIGEILTVIQSNLD